MLILSKFLKLFMDYQLSVSNTSKSILVFANEIIKRHYFITSSDRFPMPVTSAVKSNLTAWCDQNLFNRSLNALTMFAFTTGLDKLFQIFTTRAEK